MAKVYKQISELGEIVTGKTPSTSKEEYWNGEIPFITPTDIQGYDTYYQSETERTVSNIGAKKQPKTVLPPNSICVTCIGSTIGKLCITKSKSITNQQINSIITNNKNDFRYVYYLLREGLPYFQMIAGGSGSGTPIISKNKFSKFKFPVEENIVFQRKIAEILSAYDVLIENNNKRVKLLERIAEDLYCEWFVRFRFPGYENTPIINSIPKGWKIEKYSSIVEIMSGGTPNTSNKMYYGGSIPFFTPKDSTTGVFVYDTETKITKEGLQHCNSQYYPKGTLIITARGTVGKLNLLAEPMAMNQSCFALKSTILNSPYFLYYTTNNAVNKLKKMANGGVFDTIIIKTFDHLKSIMPPIEVIKTFDDKIKPIMDLIQSIQRQSTVLTRQRNLLLPRLMSGKLEVKSEIE